MRIRYVVPVLIAMALFISVAFTRAQHVMVRPLNPPVIVSGGDIAFRIEGDRGGTPVGRIVVKQEGKWVATEIGVVARNRMAQR
jgi:hypothetical protein